MATASCCFGERRWATLGFLELVTAVCQERISALTHLSQSSGCRQAVQLLTEHGFEGLTQAFSLLLNEVMRIERCEALGAAPYQRTDQRRGYANGFKDKTMRTRLRDMPLKVPQARGVDFYPQTLQRDVRSERVLTAALTGMYIQGVVFKIVEELCGC